MSACPDASKCWAWQQGTDEEAVSAALEAADVDVAISEPSESEPLDENSIELAQEDSQTEPDDSQLVERPGSSSERAVTPEPEIAPDDRIDVAEDGIDASGSESDVSTNSSDAAGDADVLAVKERETEGDQADARPVLPGPVWVNVPTNTLMGAVLVILAIASLIGRYLRRQPTEYVNPALVRRFRQRLNAWWLMFSILVFGFVLQPIGTVVLFGLVSFWALREFITMTPTRRGDHRALFWALIVITPVQYLLIALETSVSWTGLYGVYSILIPVYSSLLIPARVAISGDSKRFLERSAQITFGLLICVYSLSFAPALINLNLHYSDGTVFSGSRAGVLFFLILVSQLSEILQWTWGHLVGRRKIAPEVSSSRTWEGFIGGTLSTGMIGASLCWVTPFTFWEAACMSMVISTMGMFGGMTMSAIKRDRGVNDYGTLVLGHAGVLDRIDSLCFAAPVFYHLTRFYFA